MLDYIEQTSLKFHIERFITDHIDEQYRFQNYIIELSKSDKYIHFRITDLSAPKEYNRIKGATTKKASITKLIYKYFDAAFQRAKGNYESVMARQVFYVIRELININEKIEIGENKSIYSLYTQKIV